MDGIKFDFVGLQINVYELDRSIFMVVVKCGYEMLMALGGFGPSSRCPVVEHLDQVLA